MLAVRYHIIIGAGRSGTTSLVAYLQQHPKINFSAVKEVTYFSVKDHFKRGETFLHSFFKESDGKVDATSSKSLTTFYTQINIQAFTQRHLFLSVNKRKRAVFG